MKIDRLECVHLRFAYSDGFTYAGGTCTARVTTLVLVHTDDGRTGIGSAYTHPGIADLVIRHQLDPLLRGREIQEPEDVEALWSFMYRITRWYGRKGGAMTALGGVDTALWDLVGQRRDEPLWKLFGGEQPRCPAYASGLLWKTPDALAEEAEQHLAAGFRRMKMRLGRSYEEDVEAVRAVRAAIGPDHDLLVDGSMRYDLSAALRIEKTLAEERVFWFEEPFEPEELDLYDALRRQVATPLAAGENEFGAQGFRELIRCRAVDIVQPDASRCGGLTEVRRALRLAESAGLRAATHSWSDAVAIVANAHAIAAAPNGITVEIDRSGNPFVDQLLETPLTVHDGLLSLSEAPGLGVTLNREVVNRYRLDDPLNLSDGSYSDMLFGAEHYRPAAPYDSE